MSYMLEHCRNQKERLQELLTIKNAQIVKAKQIIVEEEEGIQENRKMILDIIEVIKWLDEKIKYELDALKGQG